MFYLLQKSQNNLYGVYILLGQLKTLKLKTTVSQYQPSSPRLLLSYD